MSHDQNFIIYLEALGLSQRTITEYIYYYGMFNGHENFSQDSVDKLIQKYPSNPIIRAAITNYKTFLLRKGWDVSKIEVPKVKGRRERKLPKILVVDDIEKIYHLMSSTRDKLLLLVSFYCGLRVSELMDIQIHSFNWNKWYRDSAKSGELLVYGKGKKERIVFVPNWLMLKIKEYIESTRKIREVKGIWHCKGNRWRNILSNYSKKAIGRHINPHLLRHSCATNLLEKGMELNEIKDYLGHQSIVTTQIYTHLSMKNLEKKYSKIVVD